MQWSKFTSGVVFSHADADFVVVDSCSIATFIGFFTPRLRHCSILSTFFLSREVARAVARIIALALDLDANFFDKPEMLGTPIAVLRLLHYEGGF